MARRLCFIANPVAGRAAWQHVIRTLALEGGAEWFETTGVGSGADIGRRAVREGCDRVVIVGGDGTIRDVIAGLGSHPPCSIAVVPAGTGNDLARTLGIPLDPVAATRLAMEGGTRRIDAIRAEDPAGSVRLGINMAVGGVAGTLGQRVPTESKEQLGPVAYIVQALKDLPTVRGHRIRVELEDRAYELDSIVVIVANGRTAAGGVRAAPGADPEDGLLEITVVRPVGPLDLARLAARLAAGDLEQSPDVLHVRAATCRILAEPPMPFNLDGDPLSTTPITFFCVRGAFEAVVGPAYSSP